MSNPIHEFAGKLVEQLKTHNKKITTIESCTGGLLSGAITSVTGSSAVFELGLVTYANHSKALLAKVPPTLLKKYGAVSAEVATAMAVGGLELAGATYSLAITGIAGPDGGSAEKPVGLVYISLGRKGAFPKTEKFNFSGNRDAVREQACMAALQLALDEVSE